MRALLFFLLAPAFAANVERPIAPLPSALTLPATLPQLDVERMRRTITDLSSGEMMGRAPMTEGSRLAREYIVGRLQEYGVQPMGADGTFIQPVKSRLFGRTIGNNVVGVIPGATKPDEFVYIDAHYDHWGKAGGELQAGANDNGSGVALLLEMARYFSQNKPDRSIVFLAADNEEGALLPMFGGLKGANFHARSELMPKNVKGALVLDTMGGAFLPGLPPSLYMIGSESSREVHGLVRELGKHEAAPPVVQIGVHAIEPLGPLVPRADYAAYRKAKVPFVFATSGIPAEYHTHEDTVDKIDFAYMGKAGAALLGTVDKLSSSNFETEFSKRGESADWREELSAVEKTAAKLSTLEGLDQAQKKAVEKLTGALKRGRERAERAVSESGASRIARRAVAKSVVLLMKAAGSLKVGEHIVRGYGDVGKPALWKSPAVRVGALVAAAAVFNLGLWLLKGSELATQFLSTYLIEWTMSLDNLVVIAAVLAGLPAAVRPAVLKWGLLGTIVLRLGMVAAGMGLAAAHPAFFVAGGLFLLAVAAKMLNPAWDVIGRLIGALKKRFGSKLGGGKTKLIAQPLIYGTLAVVGYDALFALDSVPAAVAISKSLAVVFAANVCALLGLRSLLSVLEKLEERFKHLPKGVAAVLVFVAAKMIGEPLLGFHLGSLVSTAIIVSFLAASMLAGPVLAFFRGNQK